MKLIALTLLWIAAQSAAFLVGNLYFHGEVWLDDNHVMKIVKQHRR